MKWIVLTLAVLVVTAAPASAQTEATVYRVVPSSDVSLPFWCDWGYDWEERCWRDFSNRLSVGGDEDKVWRSALRFPLGGIARGPSSSTQRCLFRSTAFASPRARPFGPVPRGTTRSTYIRSSAATGCASERSRSAPSSPGHGSGPERRNGSPGMSPTSSSNGSNPAPQRRSAAEACGRRGRLPRQRPEAAVVRVRERGPQARARGDLPAALAVLATASPRGTS